MRLDLEDIQGIVARGYGDLRAACFVLLAFVDAAAAGRWLAAVSEEVTHSDGRPAGRAVNVAFTAGGLARLGLPPASLAMFSRELMEGMVTDHRSRVLGDVGDCAPDRWEWGGPATSAVDAVLLLYATDGSALAEAYRAHAHRLADHGITEVKRLDTSDLDGVEPFGFRDSISQPIVEGLSKAAATPQTVAAGEFVLGYPNEYGQYTARPVLAGTEDRAGTLPRDAAGSGRPDLGRNGSYLVFRQLAQDTAGFWAFVERAAGAGGANDPATRLHLAAKIVGRWPGGAPLVLAPDADDPSLADANDFGYFSEDRHGLRCPIGSHVRRTNPRDSLDPDPGSERSLAVNRRHRLLRRGREYGAPTATFDRPFPAVGDGGAAETGLHFMCLNANISRQFEFVQNTWVNNPNFAGLHREPDPLIAPVAGADYRIPADPVRRRLTGLPRFVTTRGGAYFFLPGLRALRWLAARAGDTAR